MGIPQFFSWITRKYDDIIYWEDNKSVDHLYFDFNCLIYYVYNKMINEKYQSLKTLPQKKLRAEINKEVVKYIDYIINKICVPKKSIFIAMDGVVPRAKMQQQRLRRYRGPILKSWDNELKKKYGMYNEEIFDINQITPGTDFMLELSQDIQDAFTAKRIKYSPNLTIYFSDTSVPGEGEHKLMKHIQEKNIPLDNSICVYGLDADLIMLTLLQKNENLFLLRENTLVNQKQNLEFLLVSINKLRNNLFEEMKLKIGEFGSVTGQSYINKTKTTRDYVFICFFLGNDFIHHIPSLEIRNGGIDFMINIYSKTVCQMKRNLVKYQNNRFEVDMSFFRKIFEVLNHSEINNLKYIQSKKKIPNVPRFDDTYQEEKFKMDRCPLNPKFKDKFFAIDYQSSGWKKKYYLTFFSLDNDDEGDQNGINHICLNFLEAIKFTFNYYFNMETSWEWYNPYPVSPFASDIYRYLKNVKFLEDLKIDTGKVCSPLEQLMMVLPPRSVQMLPTSIKNHLENEENTISFYYPHSFDFVSEERMMVYQIEPKLPEINIREVRACFEMYKDTLTDTEKIRNQLNDVKVIYKKQ